MTPHGRGAGAKEPLNRTLDDIAQILDSADGSEARVLCSLDLLRRQVPYECCALLEAQPDREPHLVVVPEVHPERAAFLMETLTKILERLVEENMSVAVMPTGAALPHLAVPLVGLDKVIGVLFVHSANGDYSVRHLRALSMVGSKLASYLTILHARTTAALRNSEIERARLTAEAASRAKDEFLALMSQELKTPILVALEGARVLGAKDASEADRARALELVDGSLRAQARLVDNLVDLSHIAASDLRIEPQPISPAGWFKAAIEELHPQAEQKSIRLVAAIDESLTPLVADPHRLSQIVSNLLANAIQSTPSGGQVELRFERAGDHARIQVIDNGKGIDADLLPHIFERFRPANSPSQRSSGGLGIGLAIVKSLVELHGGSVRAESAGEGKGATFTVELPLAVQR